MEVLVYADRNDKKSAENILEKFKIVSYLIDYVFFRLKFFGFTGSTTTYDLNQRMLE